MSSRGRKKRKILPSERFYQMNAWLTNSIAWRATNVYERALYGELKQRYNGTNNGDIALSHREAAAALNCSNKPVTAAFVGLQEKGLIKVQTLGSFQWKVGVGASGRSTRWILTELPVDYPEKVLTPSKEFMRWKPPEKNAVCPEHTNGGTRAYHTEDHGTPKAYHNSKSV
ncbi:hypothetical protein [uncultured Agrobacterium sp.]|uniref:hypothetical protein n=1 Tax=uncultured Agrobacterium sp. TaxID=157277 RepID=UPI002585A2CB|nr:hypothetical protein [uncultured Agrobacterium sp.]